MTIRDEIIIQEAKRPGLEITIPEAEGDDILTLRLKERLTPTIASVLECDYLYTEQGSPHPFPSLDRCCLWAAACCC